MPYNDITLLNHVIEKQVLDKNGCLLRRKDIYLLRVFHSIRFKVNKNRGMGAVCEDGSLFCGCL